MISGAGLELIKEFEGWSPLLYACPAGHATIGYGHLVHLGPPDGTEPQEFVAGISAMLGCHLLAMDVREAERAVRRLVEVELTQGQFDALVSFTFNLGPGALVPSTLLRKLNAGEHDAVPAELARWVKAGPAGQKRELAGLVRRRSAESAMFVS